MSEKVNLSEMLKKRVDGLIRQVFKERREFFVSQIKNKLGDLASKNGSTVEFEWQGVESLSQLRSIVGGRFQNLKERWVNAGLPLREHKGDRESVPKIDQQHWLELSSWILKQGFETRLAQSEVDHLFEIKIKIQNN